MTGKDYLDSFLDDNERASLEYFAASDTMQQAVKKILLGGIYANGTLRAGKDPSPLMNGALGFAASTQEDPSVTNENLGEDLRAFYQGIRCVEQAYSAIQLYKKQPEKVVNDENPAI